MSERKIRTFHIPLDRVRQYLTVEEIESCVGGHVKCAIYADVVKNTRPWSAGLGEVLFRSLAGLPFDDLAAISENRILKGQVAQLSTALEIRESEVARLTSSLNEVYERVVEWKRVEGK